MGGFDRSILIVATPTGTGWLHENAVDTVEYLHAGDTAIVAMGYSYLELDKFIDEDHAIPVDPLASGSAQSLIE